MERTIYARRARQAVTFGNGCRVPEPSLRPGETCTTLAAQHQPGRSPEQRQRWRRSAMARGEIRGVAVVTGGASGIGAACCRELAARGAKLAVLDRDERAHAVAKEIGGRGFIADVAD